MFRLAHLSDIHIGPLPDVSYRDLASKRMVGYVNWQRNRRGVLTDATLATIVADLKTANPDHLAVTGDLVNLALDAEIEVARLWLETLGPPADVSVVPGNHDAYVPGAFDKICRMWGGWMTGDGTHPPTDRRSFPYMRVRENIAIIGVSTARATAPFMAHGFFREDQSHRLAKMLDQAAKASLFRVIMIHHPPIRGAVAQHKRLFGIGRFHDVIHQHGVELVLHGHSHLPTLHWMGAPKNLAPVVGVAAAGQAATGTKLGAQYNLLDISGDPGEWKLRLTRRGLTDPTTPPSDIMSIDLLPYPGARAKRA